MVARKQREREREREEGAEASMLSIRGHPQ
jgi:hypothetical protein